MDDGFDLNALPGKPVNHERNPQSFQKPRKKVNHRHPSAGLSLLDFLEENGLRGGLFAPLGGPTFPPFTPSKRMVARIQTGIPGRHGNSWFFLSFVFAPIRSLHSLVQQIRTLFARSIQGVFRHFDLVAPDNDHLDVHGASVARRILMGAV